MYSASTITLDRITTTKSKTTVKPVNCVNYKPGFSPIVEGMKKEKKPHNSKTNAFLVTC